MSLVVLLWRLSGKGDGDFSCFLRGWSITEWWVSRWAWGKRRWRRTSFCLAPKKTFNIFHFLLNKSCIFRESFSLNVQSILSPHTPPNHTTPHYTHSTGLFSFVELTWTPQRDSNLRPLDPLARSGWSEAWSLPDKALADCFRYFFSFYVCFWLCVLCLSRFNERGFGVVHLTLFHTLWLLFTLYSTHPDHTRHRGARVNKNATEQ